MGSVAPPVFRGNYTQHLPCLGNTEHKPSAPQGALVFISSEMLAECEAFGIELNTSFPTMGSQGSMARVFFSIKSSLTKKVRMCVEDILAKTEQFVRVPAVVGFEKPFLAHLRTEFLKAGCAVLPQPGALVISAGNNPHVVTAHVDRHGLVFTEDGAQYAAFHQKRKRNLPFDEKRSVFEKIGPRFVGEMVYSFDADSGAIDGAGKVMSSAYDFDAKTVQFTLDGLNALRRGTPLAYCSRVSRANGRVSSQLDNVLGVAMVRQLFEDGFNGTAILATEEEIGQSWKHIKNYLDAHKVQSKHLITVDVTPYQDAAAVDEGRVILRNKDALADFNPAVTARLRAYCQRTNTPHEFKDEVIEAENAKLPEPKTLGKTELGHIVKESQGKINGTTLQVPVINYHSNKEETSDKAIRNAYHALLAVVRA